MIAVANYADSYDIPSVFAIFLLPIFAKVPKAADVFKIRLDYNR